MALPDVVLVVRRDGEVLDSLGGRTFSLDLEPDGVIGQQLEQVLPDACAATLRASMGRVLRTREPQTLVTTADGHDYELRVSAHGRERVLAVVRDLSTDSPTPNGLLQQAGDDGVSVGREAFLHQLGDAVNAAKLSERSLALFAIGIREFARLRATLDPDAEARLGNELTQRLYSTVASCAETDHLAVTRLGADRFAVLAPGISNGEDALELGNRFTVALERAFDVAGVEVSVAPVVGVAIGPQDGTSGEHLLRNAITAMEDCITLDRSGIERYTDTRKFRTERRQDLTEELRWAISEQQLVLHYQPVFELGSATPVAVEAYLRWHHPLRGLLTAAEFLAVAEATGQIQRLSEWVLQTACTDLARLREDTGAALAVSVNLSRHYFSRTDLLAHLQQVFDDTGFDPAWLQLDITERMLMRAEQVGPVLAQLKRLGIGLQVDDFGSGFTSLKQFRRFPLDALKIDGDFIGGIGRSADDEAVCRSVIDLAHAYGMRCIAEAVETSTQVRFLRAAGCDDVQGNLFGTEMDFDALAVFLEQFRQGRSFNGEAATVERLPPVS